MLAERISEQSMHAQNSSVAINSGIVAPAIPQISRSSGFLCIDALAVDWDTLSGVQCIHQGASRFGA